MPSSINSTRDKIFTSTYTAANASEQPVVERHQFCASEPVTKESIFSEQKRKLESYIHLYASDRQLTDIKNVLTNYEH